MDFLSNLSQSIMTEGAIWAPASGRLPFPSSLLSLRQLTNQHYVRETRERERKTRAKTFPQPDSRLSPQSVSSGGGRYLVSSRAITTTTDWPPSLLPSSFHYCGCIPIIATTEYCAFFSTLSHHHLGNYV